MKQFSETAQIQVLISSHLFYPSVGGIESVSMILAEELTRHGYRVRVITSVPAAIGSNQTFDFEIIRNPTPVQLLQLVRWCDVFLHSNISLQTAWPLLLVKRPWIVVNHTTIARMDGRLSWVDHLKLFAIRRSRNYAVSEALAAQLSTGAEPIPNPYRETLFYPMPEVPRDQDLVFLGRLVEQKGLDLLLTALRLLRLQGMRPRLTVIGTGSLLSRMQQLSETMGLADQVEFIGERTGRELATLLNGHRILVIPSRPFEAFGLVALEGIACGCGVVGSAQGGLPEAIGPCGRTFKCGDPQDLADCLAALLNEPHRLSEYRQRAAEHLAHHTGSEVIAIYIQAIGEALSCPLQPRHPYDQFTAAVDPQTTTELPAAHPT